MQKIIVRRQCNENLLDSNNLHPMLKRVFAARGIASEKELEQDLKSLLSYKELKGIEEAVSVLYTSMNNDEHILILGDFDADGATSSALAMTALKSFGLHKLSYLVPNRFEYGYGLTPEIVDEAHKFDPSLIVTVDNGIASIEGVKHAHKLGMKVVITDHHLPAETLPEAEAIVNPNQIGDEFSSKHLAGVGVIFYVMLALRAKLREVDWFIANNLTEPNMAELLDLVALGTVADVVPLDKNNRILVHNGLKRIRAGKVRPGIQALLQIAGRTSSQHLVTSDLGFGVAPRLNAAGRLEDMSLGIECLLAPDISTATRIATRLDKLNNERKQIESDMQNQAAELLKTVHIRGELPSGICLYDKNWHQGVIGILASRIKERFHRPVIIFAKANETEIKGSARSIPGLHIRDALDSIASKYPGLITKFGGHAMAAGLTLKSSDFEVFSKAFDEMAAASLNADDLQSKLYSDGELSPEDFNLDFATTIKHAAPWGQNFPEPLFDNSFDIIEQRIVGEKHLKVRLAVPQTGQEIDAIAFNVDLEKWPDYRAEKLKLAYRLDINEFRGQKNIQLMVDYIEYV